MSDTETGNESSAQPTSPSNMRSMFSDDRPLSDVLTEHLSTCSKCRQVIESQRPLGMGQRTALCSEYQDIIAVWAEKEGAVNNIVNHDEFGNTTSPTFWENQSW